MTETHEEVAGAKPSILPFEAWVAFAAAYSGATYFLPFLPESGNAKVIAATLPALVGLWSALYALGGIVTLVGLFRRSPRIEGAGINLLGSGLTVATIAALQAGAPAVITLIVSGGAVGACIWRLHQLRRMS